MNSYDNPNLTIKNASNDTGSLAWSSPSNLAIIKYWGKHGIQLPQNPSLSITLDTSKTITHLAWKPKTTESKDYQICFSFEKKEQPKFATRIESFFKSIDHIFPFLKELDISIESENTFPHSSGIASSASAMSALALCLCSMEKEMFGHLQDKEEFYKKASYVARLGSGSASRSVYANFAEWGQWKGDEQYSDLYATPFLEFHHDFADIQDTILIASKAEKSVSSSAGHQLMEDNVYAAARYQQAHDRMHLLIEYLKTGNWEGFGHICENEALTLHALMMSSEASYILVKPNTLLMIERIRAFRQKTNLPVYFSLDAGPNIHLLYPKKIKEEILLFIDKELKNLCEDGLILFDQIGHGPAFHTA